MSLPKALLSLGCSVALVLSAAAQTPSADSWFTRQEIKTGTRVSNGIVSLEFSAEGDLKLLSNAGGENLLGSVPATPLWSFEVAKPGAAKPIVITPKGAASVDTVRTGTQATLLISSNIGGRSVVVSATLQPHSALIRWRIEVTLPENSDERLWSVTFPQIAVAAHDIGADENQMVVPYRRGQLRTYGKGAPRSDADLPYPGPSAKFQFMAAYGEKSRQGVYCAVEDGAGYSKSFITRNYPQANAAVFAVQHLPADRGGKVLHYETPYEVVTGPYTGDWWDAARLYRAWWVKQEWASRGLLADGAGIPPWLLRAPFATRPSTTKPERTVPNNLIALRALSDAFDGHAFFGTWYGAAAVPNGAGGLDEGHGHFLDPKPGIVDGLREMRGRGIHQMQYIQSIIYDANLHEPDDAAAQRAVTRDVTGQPVPYGGGLGPQLLSMCRATDWWQKRVADLARRGVAEWGFDGVYLDSFGKGAPECFATDHGHPVGGGNTVVAGQRALAKRVREAIKAANPQAIMSGEDPVEAFRDLLDVNLYAVNLMTNYVPIYRTVWGDYSLGHGRVLTPGPALLPELAALFLEGTIPGRIYCESPKPFLLQPESATELAFFKACVAYTDRGLEYLRQGEYLHPLKLEPAPPTIEIKESVERQLVKLPAVMHSVTRSHRDGSVAIVLVNITGDSQTVGLPIDPALLATPAKECALTRLSATGEVQTLTTGSRPQTLILTLPAHDIAFLILK